MSRLAFYIDDECIDGMEFNNKSPVPTKEFRRNHIKFPKRNSTDEQKRADDVKRQIGDS